MDVAEVREYAPVDRLLRIVVGTALLGAAAVHFIVAPHHFDQDWQHGSFFILIAALQLGLGVAILTQRGGRAALVATVVANAAIIVVWGLSRTVGIDGVTEDATFVDIFATMLQLIAIAGAVALGSPAIARMQLPRRGAQLLAAGAVLGTLVLVSASISPGLSGDDHDQSEASGDHGHGEHDFHLAHAGDDDHGEHDDGEAHADGKHGDSEAHAEGDHADGDDHSDGDAHADADHADSAAHTDGTHADGAAHDTTDDTHGHTDTGGQSTGDGHGHGDGTTDTTHGHGSGDGTTPTTHNHGGGGGTTPTTHNHGGGGGGGGTTPTWEETRRAALIGGIDSATFAAVTQANANYLTTQIRNRSSFLRSLPAAEAEARIKAYVDWTILHSLDTDHGVGNHVEGPDVWQPTDPATTAQLNGQLATANTVWPKYPTAAHAMAAGYFQVTPWVPGIGAHYLNVSYVFGFDPAHPSMLLYNGNSSTSIIVGVSYAVVGNVEPAGFAGPNDHWHEHPRLCLLGAFVIGADHTPQDQCESVGATKGNGFGGGHLYMMHLWQVPGWESAWGLMSGENPEINMRRTDVR